MKKLGLTLFAMVVSTWVVCAGTETFSGKEMKQAVVPPPCPEWYADNEFNVSLWGAYAFSGTDYNRESMGDMYNVPLFDEGPGTYDRFLDGDHAWGGGIDGKYFFHRYFGVGVEGFGLDAHQSEYHFTDFGDGERFRTSDHNFVGGVLGTITLRYPIPCTRFSPYVWGGGGGTFGGENERPIRGLLQRGVFNGAPFTDNVTHDDESRGMAQFGAGLEVRITPHIGWIADFSWNVVDGPNNNFGMARTGVNFAF